MFTTAGDSRLSGLHYNSIEQVTAILTRVMLDKLADAVQRYKPQASITVAFDGPSPMSRAVPQSARRVRDVASAALAAPSQ